MRQTVESKSLGIPLTEEVARKVDELFKTLPKECTYKRKGIVPATTELDTEKRSSIAMVSTESVDRDSDVVIAKGMNTELYALNPVVMFAHRYDELPVGRCSWVKKVSGGLRAKTVYSEATETARAVWEMTREGILKGFSIGFLPTKVRSATKDEIRRNPTWKNAGAVVEEALLLEYSVCAIPVNQHALLESVGKGRVDKAVLKRLGLMPKAKPLTEKQVAEIIEGEFRRIAKELLPSAIEKAVRESYGV
jgi:HK97 family phage prohead protease